MTHSEDCVAHGLPINLALPQHERHALGFLYAATECLVVAISNGTAELGVGVLVESVQHRTEFRQRVGMLLTHATTAARSILIALEDISPIVAPRKVGVEQLSYRLHLCGMRRRRWCLCWAEAMAQRRCGARRPGAVLVRAHSPRACQLHAHAGWAMCVRVAARCSMRSGCIRRRRMMCSAQVSVDRRGLAAHRSRRQCCRRIRLHAVHHSVAAAPPQPSQGVTVGPTCMSGGRCSL